MRSSFGIRGLKLVLCCALKAFEASLKPCISKAADIVWTFEARQQKVVRRLIFCEVFYSPVYKPVSCMAFSGFSRHKTH